MKTTLVVSAILLIATPCLAAEDIDSLRKMYEYDAKAPLDVRETLVLEQEGVKLFDLTYISPKGGRVTAYLAAPTGKGPFAGILFGHWGPGRRTEFLAEAMRYAKAGAV